MIDQKTAERLTSSAKWYESHGATREHIGMGAIYYALAYTLRANRCVCLGSGGGFVPRMMVEAQRDLVALGIIPDVDVTLVDAGDGGTSGEVPSLSDWFFLHYPEVRFLRGLTDEMVDQVGAINYLHVDADHHYEHVIADLEHYGAKMSGTWAITVHDTWTNNVGFVQAWPAVEDYAVGHDLAVVNLKIGTGTAIIVPRGGK